MKKYLPIFIALLLLGIPVFAISIFAVPQGGTGASTFTQGWIYSPGGKSALISSTSPTVNYITATSTTATSTFGGNVSVGGNSQLGTTTASSLNGIIYVDGVHFAKSPAGILSAVNTCAGISLCKTVDLGAMDITFTGSTQTISLPANIRITSSASTTLRTTGASSWSYHGIFEIPNKDNVTIDHINFVLNGQGPAVSMLGGKNTRIENSDFTGTGSGGRCAVAFDGQFGSATSTDFLFKGNTVHDMSGTACSVYLLPRNGYDVVNPQIIGNTFRYNQGASILIDENNSVYGLTVDGNYFIDLYASGLPTGAGVALFGGISNAYKIRDTKFINNHYSNSVITPPNGQNQQQGVVYLYQATNTLINNNTMYGSWTPAQKTEGPAIAPGRVLNPDHGLIVTDNLIEGFDSAWDPDSMTDVEVGYNVVKTSGACFNLGYGTQDNVNIHDNSCYNTYNPGTTYTAPILFGCSNPRKVTYENNSYFYSTSTDYSTIDSIVYLACGGTSYNHSDVSIKNNQFFIPSATISSFFKKEFGNEKQPSVVWYNKVEDSATVNLNSTYSNGNILFLGATTTYAGTTTNNALLGDSNLFWENVAKRLGIGNTSPLGVLHVTATSTAIEAIRTTVPVNGSFLTGYLSTTQYLAIGKSTNAVEIQSFSSTPLALNSQGNSVGINDTTPDFKLETTGSASNGYFGVTNSSDGDILTINSTGNIGLGSTTPGTLLSLGNTGNNTINIDPTATSTFGSGLNIRTGCFSVNNTCLSSFSNTIANGGTGSTAFAANSIITSNTDGSALIATGTQLTVGNLLATSTTATSTFLGGATVGKFLGVNITNSLARLSVSDKLRMFDTTPPNADSSTDVGYMFGSSIPSGLITEVSGQILSLGINKSQVGTVDTSRSGGIFRFDTRSSVNSFSIIGKAQSTATERERLAISLNDGTVTMGNFGGNVGIGTTSPYKLLSIGGDVVVGASTAGGTLGDLYLPKLGTAAGSFIAVDATGKVIATTTPSGIGGTNYLPLNNMWTGTNTYSATSTMSTTTAQAINGVIYVDGVHYPQTSAGIQGAYNACKSLGSTLCTQVHMPAGLYTISSPIVVSSDNIAFVGDGWNTILKNGTNLNNYAIKVDDSAARNGLTFRDFKIDANKLNNTSGGGIMASSTASSVFEHLWITAAKDYGIKFAGPAAGGYGSNNQLAHSLIDNGTGVCLYITASDEDQIHDNTFSDCQTYHIYDESGTNNYHDNVFVGGASATVAQGVYLNGSSNSRVVGNTFDGIMGTAIYAKSSYVRISDNFISVLNTSNGVSPIINDAGTGNVVVNNTVTGFHFPYAYQEKNTPSQTVINSNYFTTGTTTQAYSFGSGVTTAIGNYSTTTPGSNAYWSQIDASSNFGFNSPTGHGYNFLINGSSKMFMDSSGNLALGTTTPREKLDVIGNFNVRDSSNTKGYRFRTSGASLDFDFAGTGFFLSGYPNSDYTGTQKFYLGADTSGNMDAFSVWRFHSVPFGATTVTIDSTSGTPLAVTGGGSFTGGLAAQSLDINGTDLTISDQTTYQRIQSFNSTPLVLNSLGNNVGIGTTTPLTKLSVFGDSLVAGLETASRFVATSTATSTFAGPLAVGTTTAANANTQATFSVKGVMTVVAQFWTSTGSKILEILDSGTAILTGIWNAGDATSFEIPNGSAPVFDQIGQVGFDTTDNDLLIGTTTQNTPVSIPTMQKLWSATVASTSVDFISGGRIPLPELRDGYVIKEIYCHVESGTSVVINLDTSAGGANTDSLTCTTSSTSDTSMSANYTLSAGALMDLEIGTITGSVDYVTFSVYGTKVRE